MIVNNINTSIGSVLFPALSKEQNEKQRVKAHMRRSIKVSSYIIWPLMVGLGVCAEPLVRLILTDKWLPCVPFLQIACFSYALMPIHTTNLQAIKAMGRSDIFLKLEIIKKVVGLSVLAFSMQYGVLAIAISAIFTTITSTIINSWPNRKLLNYTYWEQIKDILPSMLLAAVMGLGVYQWIRLGLSPILTLLIQIFSGAAIYIFGSWLLKLDSFTYLLATVKKAISKKRQKKKNASR